MKNIYKYALIALAAFSFAACNDMIESSETAVDIERTIILAATREGTDPNTRSVRMDDGTTWWGPKEEISVFYGSGANGGSKFTSNNTTLAETTEFEGSISMSGNKEFWAVYPYSTDNSCDGSSIVTVIPSQQTGVEGNFSGDAFPAMGKSNSPTMPFYNICGGIKFFVSRTDIKSVTITGNCGEILAGKVQATFSAEGRPMVSDIIDGKTKITLFAPNGGTFKPGKYYYVCILPAELKEGFTISFETDTTIGTLISNKAQIIKRSTFGVLKNIDSKVTDWIQTPPKGWDLFISHSVDFAYDDLTKEASCTGFHGTSSAPRLDITENNNNLIITRDEFISWVLNDPEINMSFEEFSGKYNLDSPKLILRKGFSVPRADLPDKNDAAIVDITEINTYYSRSGTGLELNVQSQTNWNEVPTNWISLQIDNSLSEGYKDVSHYVYVLIPAKDNYKNIDIVFRFYFTIWPHDHIFTISDWQLNPDCNVGYLNMLNEDRPDGYYSPDYYYTYCGIGLEKRQYLDKSFFICHFKEFGKCWEQANDKSDYTFKVINYTNNVIDVCSYGWGYAGDDDGYAYITISGADLRAMAKGEAASPFLLFRNPSGLNVGKDIIIEVTETCTDITNGKEYKGYYFLVVDATRYTQIEFDGENIELGTFPDSNDYALIHELMPVVYLNGKKIFEWNQSSCEWTITSDGNNMGLTKPFLINIRINKLIYDKNAKDTEDSFKERLIIFEMGDPISPFPTSTVTEGGIDWRWDDSVALMSDKIAGYEIEVFYNNESLTKIQGEIKVLASGKKAHPYHHPDGTWWN